MTFASLSVEFWVIVGLMYVSAPPWIINSGRGARRPIRRSMSG